MPPENTNALYRYFYIYKPFHVLSQFSHVAGKESLKDHFRVPIDVYPVGRLDYESEGLLILTNDKRLNHALLNPVNEHEREYLAQVEGIPTPGALRQLEKGVVISVNGQDYMTRKCRAELLQTPPDVPERNPAIRYRKNVPDSWIRLCLSEGKNRQVRKMTASIGHPTLRLIRNRIERLSVTGLIPGQMREISRSELSNLLQIFK